MTPTLTLPDCWQTFHDVLYAGIDRVILFGPPGTGKTYAGLTHGVGPGGSYRLVCTDEMTAADVTGHWMPSQSGQWTWHTGAVVKAWLGDGMHGGRVVADEIDKASGDVESLLLAMFDTIDSASWTDPTTGGTVRPRPGFSVVMTTNLDDLRELPRALRDRFPVQIYIDAPHPAAIARLPHDLQSAAASLCAADPARRYSIRAFQAFAQLRDSLGQGRAAEIIFGDHAQDLTDALAVGTVL